MTAEPTKATDERAELDQLRQEVADLRRSRTGRGRRAGRWTLSVLLLVIALLLGVSAISAVFVRNQLLNTDRYVQTVAPLARDPVVQDAIADRLTNEIVTRVDLEGLANDAVAFLQKQGAPAQLSALVGPAVSGVTSFLHDKIRALVGTEQFAAAWDAANRLAHQALVDTLTGKSTNLVSQSSTSVSVNLGAFLDIVKQQLAASGFTIVNKIPEVSIQFQVLSSPDLPKIRTYVRWLDRLANWLPWITLLVLIGAVAVAPNRRRGLILAGLFMGLGLIIIRILLAALRSYYMDRLPATVQNPQALQVTLDTITRYLRQGVQILIVLALLVAIVAWLAGPGRAATWLRHGTDTVLDAAGHGLARTGLPLGPVQPFLAKYRRVGDVIVVALAVLILFLTNLPSLSTLVWLGIVALAVMAIIEILARAVAPPVRPIAAAPTAA